MWPLCTCAPVRLKVPLPFFLRDAVAGLGWSSTVTGLVLALFIIIYGQVRVVVALAGCRCWLGWFWRSSSSTLASACGGGTVYGRSRLILYADHAMFLFACVFQAFEHSTAADLNALACLNTIMPADTAMPHLCVNVVQFQSWSPSLLLQPLRQMPTNKYACVLWCGILVICPLYLGITIEVRTPPVPGNSGSALGI